MLESSDEDGPDHLAFFVGWASSRAITCFNFSCSAASSGKVSPPNAGNSFSQMALSSPCMLPVSAVIATTASLPGITTMN